MRLNNAISARLAFLYSFIRTENNHPYNWFAWVRAWWSNSQDPTKRMGLCSVMGEKEARKSCNVKERGEEREEEEGEGEGGDQDLWYIAIGENSRTGPYFSFLEKPHYIYGQIRYSTNSRRRGSGRRRKLRNQIHIETLFCNLDEKVYYFGGTWDITAAM